MYYPHGSQFLLATKFQVISRFCPSQNGHSPGFCAVNFGLKGRHKRHSKIAGAQSWENIEYNIEILYVLTLQVLSMYSAKCLVLSRFFTISGGKFQAISDLQVFQVSRLHFIQH